MRMIANNTRLAASGNPSLDDNLSPRAAFYCLPAYFEATPTQSDKQTNSDDRQSSFPFDGIGSIVNSHKLE